MNHKLAQAFRLQVKSASVYLVFHFWFSKANAKK
jgi:hypothetical protein